MKPNKEVRDRQRHKRHEIRKGKKFWNWTTSRMYRLSGLYTNQKQKLYKTLSRWHFSKIF